MVRSDDIEQALDLYRETHDGNDPDELLVVDDPVWAGRPLVALGRLEIAGYATRKGEESETVYVHEFGDEGDDSEIDDGDKPFLCIDLETGRLAIVGGKYRVNARGIVG